MDTGGIYVKKGRGKKLTKTPEAYLNISNKTIMICDDADWSGEEALINQLEYVSFVFIDEFDAFYHYNLSKAVILELLKLENTQSLLTTHNTDIMTNDLLRPDCYLQIIWGKVKSFAESTEKELRKAHNLQKMYHARAFDE